MNYADSSQTKFHLSHSVLIHSFFSFAQHLTASSVAASSWGPWRLTHMSTSKGGPPAKVDHQQRWTTSKGGPPAKVDHQQRWTTSKGGPHMDTVLQGLRHCFHVWSSSCSLLFCCNWHQCLQQQLLWVYKNDDQEMQIWEVAGMIISCWCCPWHNSQNYW